MSSHASAPSGFSDVSATYADKFIRISSGTPLNTGGSNTHNHGGSAGNHSLTIAQMPSHSHTVDRRTGSGAGSYNIGWNDYPASKVSGLVGSTGGGDSHNHSISSADNIPAYVQVKMYQKD
jgi:microcystin-dependent protein